MKILYIVTAYPRWEGDVITPWLTELIRRMRPRGVEVEVLAPAYRGMGDQEIGGVRVHRFRYAPAALETLTHDQTAPDRVRERPWYAALLPGYVAAGSTAAARLARGGGFDAVHAFWPLPHGLQGLAAKRASGLPLVSTFFGVELTWVESGLRPLKPVVRGIIRGSDAVTVISSHTRAAALRIAPEADLEVIPFGAAVDVAGSHAAAPPTAAQDERPFRILFVGRLVERKGVHVLLKAMGRLRDAPVELRVVGDGPWRRRLEDGAAAEGVADRVRFLGFVDADALSRELEACDAFVLPAVQDAKGDVEGLGVVLLEALAHGKPVIASASGGIVDIVRDGETGLLVPSGDADALAAAIRRLSADRDLARRLVEGGRRHVAESFSWESITDRLARLYARVASKRAGAPV